DDQIPDRRILVARHEPDLALLPREEDRAPIEPEALAELAGDRLEDVDEVERGGDLLQDVDDRGEVVALALERGEARPEARHLVILGGKLRALGRLGAIRRECVRLLHPSWQGAS